MSKRIILKKWQKIWKLEFLKETWYITYGKGRRRYYWIFKCECGNKKELCISYVRYWKTSSCWCLQIASRKSRVIKVKKWEKYGLITIVKEVESIWYRRRVLWVCKCWFSKEFDLFSLTKWHTKSCWCLSKKKLSERIKTHWMRNKRIYKIWCNMKQRCNVEKNKWYHRYWWRWITYDPKREKFESFYEDMREWYSDELTLDRIDNDWNYCKENCRRVTIKKQSQNRSNNIIYKWKCLKHRCEELNLVYSKVYSRFKNHWRTIEESLWLKDRD